MYLKAFRALAEPGEAVGLLAAQVRTLKSSVHPVCVDYIHTIFGAPLPPPLLIFFSSGEGIDHLSVIGMTNKIVWTLLNLRVQVIKKILIKREPQFTEKGLENQ